MSKGDIQYLADTLLLQKLITIDAGLTKNASLIDTFKGLTNGIVSSVSSRVKQEGVGVLFTEMLTVGFLMRLLGPIGYLIVAAAQFLGIDIAGIIKSIASTIKNKLEQGESVTADDVNSVGKSVGSMYVSESMASNDMFHDVRAMDKNNQLFSMMKNAQFGGRGYSRTFSNVPWFAQKGYRHSGVGGRLAGALFMGGGKGKWLLIGIIVWLIKTILMGAGVMHISPTIKQQLFKEEDKPIKQPQEDHEQPKENEDMLTSFKQPTIQLPNFIKHNLDHSGQGTQYHVNDQNHIWIVPMANRSIENTLIWWATSIYSELRGHENDIRSADSFINLVSKMSAGVDPSSPDYLVIPKGLHTRKQIVDIFAGEVAKNLHKDENAA